MINTQKLFIPLLMTGTLLYSTASLANTRPIAEKQNITMAEDSSEEITLAASDADGDTLTYKIVRKPRRGTLSEISEGIYTYTPKANFNGRDRFLFHVSDGIARSRIALVKISVEADANDILTADTLSVSTNENKPLRFKLSASENRHGLSYVIHTEPRHGRLTLRRNRVSYQPEKNYNGSDSFQYTVSKDGSSSEPATVTISIAAINSNPTAEDQLIEVGKDITQTITLQGADAEDESPRYAIIRQPRRGELSLQGTEASYIPKEGYTGTDSFSYRVADSEGLRSRIAKVKLTIVETELPEAEDSPAPAPTGKLNDTGITQSDANGDDATTGRDVTENDDSDGHAGFSFMKIDVQGHALPTEATSWNCVKDKVTGLVWEVKQGVPNNIIGDTGLHDPDDRYNWFEPDGSKNGGLAGYTNNDGAVCHGFNSNNAATYCNTNTYIERVNAQGWCGANDWRLPTRKELRSLVNYNKPYPGPTIDTAYFPHTKATTSGSFGLTWSSSPYASNREGAWAIDFSNGYDNLGDKASHLYVRLVR